MSGNGGDFSMKSSSTQSTLVISMVFETLSFSSTSFIVWYDQDESRKYYATFSLRCIMIDFRLRSILGLDIRSSQGIHRRNVIRTWRSIHTITVQYIEYKIIFKPILASDECLMLCGGSWAPGLWWPLSWPPWTWSLKYVPINKYVRKEKKY